MTIFRTNDPTRYAEVDGIVIDERAPEPSIRGVSTGVAICVGRFEKGPFEQLTEIGSFDELKETFGEGTSGDRSSGYRALVGKRFSRLKVVRVMETPAVKATLTINDGSNNPVVRLTAKQFGTAGNTIKVTVTAGDDGDHKDFKIQRGAETAETYDEVETDEIAAMLGTSQLVDVEILDATKTVANLAETALAGGAAAVVPTDSDYSDAIDVAAADNSGNVLFLDDYGEDSAAVKTRNGKLVSHAAETQDKMVICAGLQSETVSEAVTAVDDFRDTDGRIIYAYNWLKTRIDGVETTVSPASYVASIISNTSPHIDPAFVDNSQFLYSVTGIDRQLSRASYVALMAAGIMAFQRDPDTGFGVRSGIVTQTLDSSKVTVLRRRMADWISNSIGAFLKNYQGAPNSVTNRQAAKNAILSWINTQEQLGILPGDSEVQDGFAKIVDVESRNSNQSIAEGKFIIDYRQRIYSSMRFIVLVAEIGQSVVVTEEPS